MYFTENNISGEYIDTLCGKFQKNFTDPSPYFNKLDVKRGLRNADGTGVMAGLTEICNVHGYLVNEGEKMPVEGELVYRGINIRHLVEGSRRENRFGFEETAYLILFGSLPTKDELDEFNKTLASCRALPEGFTEDIILKVPSENIMNSLSRSVLSLYAYDKNPDDVSLQNLIKQSIQLIAKFPSLVVNAYQVRRRYYDKGSMYFHYPKDEFSTAENFLRTMRSDKKFERSEAMLLDLSLMLHAEHGGGNNSAFASRVLASSGTDTYSCISAAIGALKGPKHGGANAKVSAMVEEIKANVSDWNNEDELASYLEKIIRKQAGDGSGLIYGMGHAVYTVSDPRAVLLKEWAEELMIGDEARAELELLKNIEKLTPSVFNAVKGNNRVIGANIDLYSGLVLRSLGIPQELLTPLFATARIVGWCAHRIEELIMGGKIIRPAYRAIAQNKVYIPISER